MPAEAPPALPAAPAGPSQVIARPSGTTTTVIDAGPKYGMQPKSPSKSQDKPGGAKQALADKIASKATRPGEYPAEAVAQATVPKELDKPTTETPPTDTPPETPTPEVKPGTETKPEAGTEKKGKVNPWKLVDEHKAARAKAETELSDLRKLIPNVEDRKKELEIVKSIYDRNKALEDEIRHVRYESSTEFKEKFDAPYLKAWESGMKELEGFTVNDGADGSRAITPQDMLTLVNLPAGQARQVAREAFGDDAEEVLAVRRKIRDLNDARMGALDDAKANGAKRDQERMTQAKQWNEQTQAFIKENWDKGNADILADPKIGEFFKEREGDPDWNQRLAKGYGLVDRAFSENPKDPKLTPEQRRDIIKRHASIRHRAAGWGPLKLEVTRLRSKLAAMEKELGEYKGSTPEPGGRTSPAAPASNGHGLQPLLDRLSKRAK